MNKYLEKALEVATRSRCRYKHGCVVVNNGKIVSTATNKKVGDPEIAWRKAHIHAEIAAVLAAGRYAAGANVYVARVTKSGKPAESQPCKKCERFLNRMGVSQVVWT